MAKKKTLKGFKLKARNALQKKAPLKRSKTIKKPEVHKSSPKKAKPQKQEEQAPEIAPVAFQEIKIKFVDESKGKTLTAEGWKRLFKKLNS